MKFILKKVSGFTFKIPGMHTRIFIFIGIITISLSSSAQTKNPPDSARYFTLDQCIAYALQHQPVLMSSIINIEIVKKNNAISLSSFIPQVNAIGSFTDYFELPTGFETNSEGVLVPVKTGLTYTAIPEANVTETFFSPDLIYAASSAHLFVNQAKQSTDSNKINTIASVSKAFYNLLLTLQQIGAYKEDTTQLARNVRDTYHQYVGGTVDRTDYEEATISLNNALEQLKQAQLNVRPQYATLKQLMGFAPDSQFTVKYDTAQMIQQIAFDTTQLLKFENRIEYQQIQTAKSLKNKLINYYRFDWLPTLSAYYDYNYEYESNSFSNLFTQAYPNSLIGIGIDIPIFTGFRRIENTQKAKLQEQQLDWSEVNLKSSVYTQYETALAAYKSNLYSLHFNQKNVALGKDVYTIVSLQYKQGIVPYLNVITAQTDWITSEINYLNALFEVLSSKIDLEQSMGLISPNR